MTEPGLKVEDEDVIVRVSLTLPTGGTVRMAVNRHAGEGVNGREARLARMYLSYRVGREFMSQARVTEMAEAALAAMAAADGHTRHHDVIVSMDSGVNYRSTSFNRHDLTVTSRRANGLEQLTEATGEAS